MPGRISEDRVDEIVESPKKGGFCDDRICTDTAPTPMSAANTGGKHKAGISHKNPIVIVEDDRCRKSGSSRCSPGSAGSGSDSKKRIIRWQNKKDGAIIDDVAPSLRASGGTDIRKKPVLILSPKEHIGVKRIGNKFRVHRTDDRRSEIQGLSVFTTDGICDVVDNHAKNIIIGNRPIEITHGTGIAPSPHPSAQMKRSEQDVFVMESGLIHSRGLETRKDGVSHCLKGGGGGSSKNFVVSGPMRSTGTPAGSTARTSGTESSLRETSQQLTLNKSPISTCSPLDFLANHFPRQARGKASKMFVERCSTILPVLRRLRDPAFYSLRTSRDSSRQTGGDALPPFFESWGTWGIASNGRCLTAGITACRRTGNGSSLSDILEDEVDEKYFLSEKSMKFLRMKLNDRKYQGWRSAEQWIHLIGKGWMGSER